VFFHGLYDRDREHFDPEDQQDPDLLYHSVRATSRQSPHHDPSYPVELNMDPASVPEVDQADDCEAGKIVRDSLIHNPDCMPDLASQSVDRDHSDHEMWNHEHRDQMVNEDHNPDPVNQEPPSLSLLAERDLVAQQLAFSPPFHLHCSRSQSR
jgi:hypothetical protein